MSVRESELVDERPIPLGRQADPAPAGARTVRVQAEGTAAEVTPLAGPPLAAFRRFRMEVEVVEPAFRRGHGCVGRLILTYALVMALVLALIAAFVACATHGGGAAA